jgi:hypothetical protein
MIVFVLHENHVSYFKSMNEVFDTRTKISTASPNVFNKGDFLRIDLQLFGEPSVVELHTFVFEEDELIRFVENLDSHHRETRIVTACHSNVVEIVETDAELGANQRVGWRIHFSSHTVGLETENACSNIINIVPPTGYHGVSVDLSTGNSSTGQRSFERIPSLLVGYLLFESNTASLADETILASTTKSLK